MSFERGALGAALCLVFASAAPSALAQYVSLAGGTPVVQDFNTLAASGTSAVLPDGWYLAESGSNANTTYSASNGTANAGDTYSFGLNSDRALGMLRSGSLAPTIGAQLRNDTVLAVSEIAVAFTGEQWRLGTAGRSDRIAAQYSLNAISLSDSTATWVSIAALDFISPVSSGPTGALDGNAAANRSAIAASITGLNLAPNASLWLRWVDMDASGADDGLAIDDISFAVAGDPPVDVPPTVTATTPANNATGIAPGAILTVTLSEAVTMSDPWFSLNCATSGNHTATVSGGSASYTLTPSPAFAPNESCTWTILASGIVDLDGTADHPTADTVVVFQTLDPTTSPPTVVSITPADGAIHVPAASDVHVSFSEAVTTTANAFALACDAAPIVLTETGTGALRTLTPTTVLPASANCTFIISASEVRNGFNVPLAADAVSHFSINNGGGVGDYYSHVNTSSPDQLRCSLHLTIRGHTAYPYSGSGTNTWTILELAQSNPANAAQILDVYRNHFYTAITDRAGGSGGGITYNREHTWPNSLGFPTDTGNLGLPNAPYTDTHMLYLSDTQWNADRGNSPYANCATNCGERTTEASGGFGGGSGVYPGNSNWTNSSTFQTWNHRKGDVARAVMYMAIRYEGGVDPVSGQTEPELELTDNRALVVGRNDYTQPAYMGLLTDLLAWNQDDPPDDAERARDAVIYSFQGNRNPFVDHPEWATRALFESVNPSICAPLSNDVIFANGFE